jgi:diketogulonate reductase-like aldo/keto reductase
MHWPDAWVKPDPFTFFPKDENGDWITKSVPIGSTWAAMEKLVMAGKARSIGVSNFSQSQLEELISTYLCPSKAFGPNDVPSAKIIPAVNQVEAHPYRSKKELLTWCSSKATSYSSLRLSEY